MNPKLASRFGVDPDTVGSDPFKMEFHRRDGGGFRTDAVTVYGQYTRYYPGTMGTPGFGILQDEEAKGRDFLEDEWQFGEGIAVAFDLTDVWRNERFNAEHNVVTPEDAHFRHGYKMVT